MSARRPMTNVLVPIRFPIGGIRNYLRYVHGRLDPDRYALTLLTIDREEGRLLATGLGPVRVDHVEVPERHAAFRLFARTRSLLDARSFKLIHSQGFTAGIAAALGAAGRRVPHVLTLHETLRAEQFSGVAGAVKRRLLARVLERIDRVVLVTADAQDNLLQFLPLSGNARSRLRVIRNGVAVDVLLRDARAGGTFRREHGLGDETFLLGFVGRFMPEKGFDLLIEALRRLVASPSRMPSFRIVAVNDGAFVREYRQKIADLGLEERFLFPGFQPAIAGLLSEFDALCVPSLREACGLAALEALVVGVPLIASDCLGLREVTRGSPAVVFASGDPDDLARAIRSSLDSRKALRDRAADYATLARAEFDSSVTARRLEALFEELLVEAPGQRA